MDKRNTLVTAVITTYKRPADMVKRAVLSTLNQTHKNMETIIVNDCPEEKELALQIGQMLDELHDERVKYIVHEKNMGACKARNTGISASKGEFIEFLDDDDEWLPQKTEKQLQGFINDKIGMVYSPFYNYTSDEKVKIIIDGTFSGDVVEPLLRGNFIGGSSMTLIKKNVFNKCGIFDERLLSSQDYDMWLRIALKYEVAYVNEPLINRFLLDESITMNFNKQKQGVLLFLEKHRKLYEQYPEAYNCKLNDRVKFWIERGEVKDALKLYREAVKVKFFTINNLTYIMKGFIKLAIKRVKK